MCSLPDGWVVKALGDVALVSAGNSAPQDKELFENGAFPFIRTSDVGKIKEKCFFRDLPILAGGLQ